MKTSLQILVTALFMLLLVCCKPPEPSSSQTGCLQSPPDKKVSDSAALVWMENWGKYWLDKKCTPLERGFWPVQFKTDMNSFKSLISNYDQFRVYYAFCNSISDTSRAHLLAAPLDNTDCKSVLGNNIYSFATDFANISPPYTDCSPSGATTTTIPKDNAITWTENFREKFGLSTEKDTVTLACSGITFTIPIAFSYDKTTFERYINQDADSLYVKLGIDSIPQTEGPPKFLFKLLFDTAPEHGGEGIEYVDFASPCPQACGDGGDLLLGQSALQKND